eukprot:1508444-Heterocapsa_arctica.AAC.1
MTSAATPEAWRIMDAQLHSPEQPANSAPAPAAVQEAPPATMAVAMAVDAGEAVAVPPVDAVPVDAAV